MAKKKVKEVEATKDNEVEVINPEDLIEKKEQQDIKNGFWTEFKAFLILALIIGVLVASGWFWFTHIYKEADDKGQVKTNEENGYKYISYKAEDGNSLEVLDDKYVILFDETSVLKVMDLDLNVIYENEVEYTGYYLGNDNNLYFYKEEQNDEDGTNIINLYRLEDKDIVEVKKLQKDNTYYRPLYVKKDNDEKIMGYVGIAFDENDPEKVSEDVYLLNGKEYEVDNMLFVSDEAQLSVTDPLYINSDKYIIYIGDNDKYGVYNIADGAKVIEANYEALYRDANNNNFIALKNKKYGIIDTTLKKVVDYKYDFIDVNDGYYVVGNDNKLALMDSEYKLITGFDFDYQDPNDMDYLYVECCGNYNTFSSYKINDKYLLVTNVNDYIDDVTYNKHEAYLINKDGKFDTINEHDLYVDEVNKLIWVYDKDSKQFTFYDLDFNLLYKLDFNNYDFDEEPNLNVAYGTLYADFLESKLYYDAKTGESIEKAKDYEDKVLDKVEIKLDGKEQKSYVYLDGKEIFTYNYNNENGYELYHKVNDKQILYYDDNTYFMIKKSS